MSHQSKHFTNSLVKEKKEPGAQIVMMQMHYRVTVSQDILHNSFNMKRKVV